MGGLFLVVDAFDFVHTTKKEVDHNFWGVYHYQWWNKQVEGFLPCLVKIFFLLLQISSEFCQTIYIFLMRLTDS